MNVTPSVPGMEQGREAVYHLVCDIQSAGRSPSASELVEEVEREFGWWGRWCIKTAIERVVGDDNSPRAWRQNLEYMLEEGELDRALAGAKSARKDVQSGIDSLVSQSQRYRASAAFQEMISFMGRFREYAPYNNMLVRIQNSSCSFYATEGDWQRNFERRLKEDARPMLILAPMHPVLLVYDLDQTEGKELPQELAQFSKFTGKWNDDFLHRAIGNAEKRDRIRVDRKDLSSTNTGLAATSRDGEFKMRIALHRELDAPSQFGVLCHELAHIYLGHLGTDTDYWWPSRRNLDLHTIEIEAEAVAFIVTSRMGLNGASAAYVSQHLKEPKIPASVSLDLIAKTAGRIEEMARRSMAERQTRQEKQTSGRLF